MAMQEISAFSNFSGTNEQGYVIVGGSNGVEGGKKILSDIIPVVPEQVQADWNQDDNTQKDYIKNKPTPLPEIGEDTYKVLTLDKDGNPVWGTPLTPLDVNDYGDLTCGRTGTCQPLYYDDSSGAYAIRYDDTLIDINYGDEQHPIYHLSVKVPIPDPNPSEGTQVDDGSVLTYNANSDEIVWAAPQGGGGTTLPDTTTANAGDVLTLDNNKGLSWSAPQGGGSSTSIIFLNTNTMTATLNGNPITPGEVMELVKTNPYIVLRKCWDYQGVTYYGYDNYYVANYLNGEQQLLYFVCQDFGSGDTVYTDAVRANNCNPSNPIWENV